jgi:hypothetical protein
MVDPKIREIASEVLFTQYQYHFCSSQTILMA